MEIEIEEEILTEKTYDNLVHVIILKVNNPSLSSKVKSFELPLLGKGMLKWVETATSAYQTSTVECGITADIFTTIYPYLNDSKTTLVLYSDTPLLTSGTIAQIIDYFTMKDMKVCKLSRGVIFDTEYFKSASKIFAPQAYSLNEEEFYPAVSMVAMANIIKVLKQRINSFHMNNGVYLHDPNTTVIEPDVVIGKNVTIYANNHIKGDSVISEGTILKENNVLESVVVLADANIMGSIIKNSVISESTYIMPFCTITNKSMVGKNSIIHSFVQLNNAYIGENSEIKSYNHIGKE